MKVGLIGYGKMGQMIAYLAPLHEIEIVATFTDLHPLNEDVNTKESLKEATVLIDFSVPAAVMDNIRIGAALSKNIVVGTTGWYDSLGAAKAIVEKSSIGMVYAPNFSIGINLFYRVVESAAKIFSAFPNYDAYIEESHHKFKKDAPSGTALIIQKMVAKAYQGKSIPVSSTRAGYIPGSHVVGFDSKVDTIRLKHTARTREGFAIGAILAAKWIPGKKGLYSFHDVLESKLNG